MAKRDTTISILKGIGIILVVLGHAAIYNPNSYRYVHTFIYSFHMPLFLIASGFFFKRGCLSDFKGFAKRKINGIYIPFVKWSLIFLLLHNVFFYFGILNSEYGYNGVGTVLYSPKQIGLYALDICVRMEHYEGFHLGAYWFMRSLFLATIFLCLFSALLNRVLKNETRSIIIVALLFFTFAFVKALLNVDIPLWPQGGFRDLISVSFIGIGYVFGQTNAKLILEKNAAFVSVLIITLCLVIYPGKMMAGSNWKDCVSLMFSGSAGFVLLYCLSRWLNGKDAKIGNILVFIGNNTFYILTFHFLMFKPISLLKALWYGLDWKMVGCHPVIDEYNNWWWIAIYVIFSVSASLFFGRMCERIKYLRLK